MSEFSHVPEETSIQFINNNLNIIYMDGKRIILTVTADNEPFVMAGNRLLEGRLHRVLVASQSHSLDIHWWTTRGFDINSTCFVLIIIIVMNLLPVFLFYHMARLFCSCERCSSSLDSGFCWLAWWLGKHSALRNNVNQSSASRFAPTQKIIPESMVNLDQLVTRSRNCFKVRAPQWPRAVFEDFEHVSGYFFIQRKRKRKRKHLQLFTLSVGYASLKFCRRNRVWWKKTRAVITITGVYMFIVYYFLNWRQCQSVQNVPGIKQSPSNKVLDGKYQLRLGRTRNDREYFGIYFSIDTSQVLCNEQRVTKKAGCTENSESHEQNRTYLRRCRGSNV